MLDSSRVVVDASVESFHHEDEQYWFTVRAEMGSGAIRNLFRLYEDFYNFHITLLEEFPVESGRAGDQPRILPFIPIPLPQVTDIVTASRRVDLNEYVHELCRLPTRITHHPLMEQLFTVKDGDTEMAAPPSQPHLSTVSNSTTSTTTTTTKTDRRISPTTTTTLGNATHHTTTISTTNTNGGPTTTTTTTTATNNTRRGATVSGSSFGHAPAVSTAALTIGSTAIQGAGVGTGSSGGMAVAAGTMEEMVKIKIAYLDDIMAMRIPTSISLETLRKRIFERLNIDSGKDLSYRDDRGGFATLQRNADIKKAIERSGGKLMIYVD